VMRVRWRAPRRGATVATVVALVAGCGVQQDAAPREVPEEFVAERRGASVGGQASGESRIYLVGPGDDRLLRSVPRETGPGENLINVLLRGPNEGEAGFGSAIPATLRLNRISQSGSRLRIDVSSDLVELSGSGLVQALAQIVYTADEIPGVDSVDITVEGQDQAWPTADLDTTTAPLRVYDYPGAVRSAQPAYPSVPSGG
jgi:hypothetical protein